MADVNFGFICHGSEVSDRGFLKANGIGFDTVITAKIPVQFPTFYALLSVRFGPGETGTHEISIRLIDSDGDDIANPIDETFTVPPPPSTHFYRNHRITTPVENLVFPKYGEYVVIWLLDGHEVHRANITVFDPTGPA